MPLCCWDDCNADSADGARLFKIYIRFSAPARGFIHSWLWVRNDHLLKQTITVERSVMAEIMSSCGEGARALHEDALPWYVCAVTCPKWKIWSHRALPQKLGPVSFSDIVACYSLCLETLGCCTLELCCDITGLVLCSLWLLCSPVVGQHLCSVLSLFKFQLSLHFAAPISKVL